MPMDPVSPPPSTSPASKWYHNVWTVLLLLFFVLGPLGLPLVWKNPRFGRGMKWVLTAVVVVYTIVLVDMTVRATQSVLHAVGDIRSSF